MLLNLKNYTCILHKRTNYMELPSRHKFNFFHQTKEINLVKEEPSTNEITSRSDRFKVKKRIVIGNVSKWVTNWNRCDGQLIDNFLLIEIWVSCWFFSYLELITYCRYIPVDRRDENDQSTHKWMVYVRGPKGEPNIDHFVKKVWFFLHPSYRPNDLVEVL